MKFDSTDEAQLWATGGRGLGLVAMLSTAWGADLTPDGKVVWFAPAAEPRVGADLSGDVFDLEQAVQAVSPPDPSPDLTRIQIRGLPVAAYARFRQRYFDLARELRLLSLAPGGEYPVARRFSAVFLEAERLGQQTQGRDRLDAAVARHRVKVDVDLFVPPAMPDVMGRLLDTLEQVDELCRQEHMLTLGASRAEQRLIRWWFTEFVRQGAGDVPTPWRDYVYLEGRVPDPMPGRSGTSSA
jgi:hypothetical protein